MKQLICLICLTLINSNCYADKQQYCLELSQFSKSIIHFRNNGDSRLDIFNKVTSQIIKLPGETEFERFFSVLSVYETYDVPKEIDSDVVATMSFDACMEVLKY